MSDRPRRRCLAHFAGLMLVACTIGCSKYDARVSGLVSLDGNRLDHGTVKFTPLSSGSPAYGMVDEEGFYQLQTGREPGLPSGEYAATVVCLENTIEGWQGSGPPPPGKPIVPPWYGDQQTSGLKFIVDSGRNQINLELNSEMSEELRQQTLQIQSSDR